MKLNALGEVGIFLMATSSQIEHHRRRCLETLGALGEGAHQNLAPLEKTRSETMRLRRRRLEKLCVLGEGA